MSTHRKKEVVEIKNIDFASDEKTVSYRNHQFINTGAVKRNFFRCDFSFSIFKYAYFRNCEFVHCNFRGSRFEDSKFPGSKFSRCEFEYSSFKSTIIESDEIFRNLPDRPNVRYELMRNLKVNAASNGDHGEVRKYLLEELHSQREHWRRAREAKDGWYQSHYRGVRHWISVRARLAWYWIAWNIWGYGESAPKLARAILIGYGLILAWGCIQSAVIEEAIELREVIDIIKKAFTVVSSQYIMGVDSSSNVLPTPIAWVLQVYRFFTFGWILAFVIHRTSSRVNL